MPKPVTIERACAWKQTVNGIGNTLTIESYWVSVLIKPKSFLRALVFSIQYSVFIALWSP